MVRYMMSHEGAHTTCEPFDNSSLAPLTVGMKNVQPESVMETISTLSNAMIFTIRRVFVAHLTANRTDAITVMHLILETAEGKPFAPIHCRCVNLVKRSVP